MESGGGRRRRGGAEHPRSAGAARPTVQRARAARTVRRQRRRGRMVSVDESAAMAARGGRPPPVDRLRSGHHRRRGAAPRPRRPCRPGRTETTHHQRACPRGHRRGRPECGEGGSTASANAATGRPPVEAPGGRAPEAAVRTPRTQKDPALRAGWCVCAGRYGGRLTAQGATRLRRPPGRPKAPDAVFREGNEWSPGDTCYRTGPHPLQRRARPPYSTWRGWRIRSPPSACRSDTGHIAHPGEGGESAAPRRGFGGLAPAGFPRAGPTCDDSPCVA